MNIPSSRLLFLHANGYPAGVYRAFLDLLATRWTVHAIDTIGTEAQHRPGHGWRRMRAQVMDCIDALPDGPLVLVGQSMGGYLAAMAAARLPQRVSQVVLMERLRERRCEDWLDSSLQGKERAVKASQAGQRI